MMQCIICGGSLIEFKTLYDDRYGYPGEFSIAKCTCCGHKSLNSSFNSNEITCLYSDYYPRSSNKLGEYKPHQEISGIDSWLRGDRFHAFRWVPNNVRVLDIGCGFGETLGYHQARGCDAYGVEADTNISRVAEKFGYNVHVGLFDPDIYETNYFDYITMDQVIEHISNPIEMLSNVAKVMKPGGTLILSTPNANGWGSKIFGGRWINWHVPYHLQFFTKNSIGIMANKSGFILEKRITITNSDWLYFQWNHLLTFPRMGQPSLFWSPKAIPDHRADSIFSTMKFIHKSRINHIFTRIFDILHIGDNLLIVLKKPV
jgi:SAM-dependent methyltransferase